MTERRSAIPGATEELLAAGQRKVGEGRLNLRSLPPVGADDEETERNVQEITQSYGAHAQIAPAKEGAAPPIAKDATTAPPSQRRPAVARTKFASFRVDLPEYLDQELTVRSARDRVTKTYLIMDALRRAGFKVQPEDLVTDRRKTRWRGE
jgi:hypothetical protein